MGVKPHNGLAEKIVVNYTKVGNGESLTWENRNNSLGQEGVNYSFLKK